jgi:hypothetical protein
MRAPTILWLLLRSRKTDLILVVGEPRDYHAGETGSREGSWKRRRLYTFQLLDHTRVCGGATQPQSRKTLERQTIVAIVVNDGAQAKPSALANAFAVQGIGEHDFLG